MFAMSDLCDRMVSIFCMGLFDLVENSEQGEREREREREILGLTNGIANVVLLYTII
jgi:hypothetical protein